MPLLEAKNKKRAFRASVIALLSVVKIFPFLLYAEENYILHSPKYNPGMFSLFSTVVGFLDFYEEKGCAIEVDLENKGAYYDKKKGANWWTYYFEPISLGTKSANAIEVGDAEQAAFANQTLSHMSREKAQQLIEKYIVIKKPLQKKIDAFVKKHFQDQFVIGVHYRGTDKISEAPRIAYEQVFKEVEKAAHAHPSYKLFVATDEQAFLDAISARFQGKVVFLDAIRSSNGKALHASQKNGFQKGEEALLDCVLLSKTNLLIRTASNLSACSALFNAHLPVILLEH